MSEDHGHARLPNPPLNASVTDIEEADLIDRLLANSLDRPTLFNTVGMPNNPRVLVRVSLPDPYQGDVDILAFEPGRLDVLTVIEAKVIKFRPQAFEEWAEPNGLPRITEGIKQANRLAEVGFAQAYLYIFVLVDSRVHNEGRYTYDGLPAEKRCPLRDAVKSVALRRLNARVGLDIRELVQPMDRPPLTIGTGETSSIRVATIQPQPQALTDWLAQTLERDDIRKLER